MRATFRVLAILISVEVVIQAMAIAYAVFGLTHWIDEGATLDKAAMESDDVSFDGLVGFIVHGINGTMLIPLIALLLLIVSFFAKVPGGVRFGAVIFVLVIAQVALGMFAHDVPSLGALHGLVAMLILGAGIAAARAASATAAAPAESVHV